MILALAGVAARAATTSTTTTTARAATVVHRQPAKCTERLHALIFYRDAYNRWRARMHLPGAYDPIRLGCAHVRRAALAWRTKAQATRRSIGDWLTENYAWAVWLPDKWQRVGACETGYGERPGNFQHENSSYVSFVGIQRGAGRGHYDADAARVGMPPWDRYFFFPHRGRVLIHPTPREQYETALSHYEQFGGFSGWGCRGA